MILYHGSFTNFDNFVVSPELARHDIQTVLPEGLGVYMTEKKEIAKSYGDILYYIEATEIYNFTTIKAIYKIINDFLTEYDTNKILKRVLQSKESKVTFEAIKIGKISILKIIKELWDMHEKNIHSLNLKFDIYEYEKFLIEDWEKFLEKKVIKYYCKGLGAVYITKNATIFFSIFLTKFVSHCQYKVSKEK